MTDLESLSATSPREAETSVDRFTSDSVLLGQVTERLNSVERKLSKHTSQNLQDGPVALQLLKLALTGWPVFSFVFLILFYSPLRDVLVGTAERVRSANQIEIAGFFKSTLKAEADRAGASTLADIIPSLSPLAIQRLLRGWGSNVLLTYGVDFKDDRITAVSFPDPQELAILAELEAKGMIYVLTGLQGEREREVTDIAAIKTYISDFKNTHLGKPTIDERGRPNLDWILATPLKRSDKAIRTATWQPTALGTKASDVILNSVSTILMERPRSSL